MNNAHAPDFIAEMQAILAEEKGKLEQDIIATSEIPEYGRDDEDNIAEVADLRALLSTKETLQERLANVVAALARIEDGTYGVTEEGDIIPEDRLRANPAAQDIVK